MLKSFIEAPTTFYLGRRYDPGRGQLTDEVVYYDSRDLTTHAVVLGMTGSGKTGLCITLLEEAILDNLPAIVIDPKGDITNLLLNFPELRPDQVEPWVNVDDARRAGMDVPRVRGQTGGRLAQRVGRLGYRAGPAALAADGRPLQRLYARLGRGPADQHPRLAARPRRRLGSRRRRQPGTGQWYGHRLAGADRAGRRGDA